MKACKPAPQRHSDTQYDTPGPTRARCQCTAATRAATPSRQSRRGRCRRLKWKSRLAPARVLWNRGQRPRMTEQPRRQGRDRHAAQALGTAPLVYALTSSKWQPVSASSNGACRMHSSPNQSMADCQHLAVQATSCRTPSRPNQTMTFRMAVW